jgi:hypothetical protein
MQTSDVLRVGKSLSVTASAFDPVTKYPITGGTCTVDFFAPPKDPDDNPSDRTVDHTVTGTFDSGQNAYIATISTTGWPAGKWFYRTTITDSNGNVDFVYDTFILKA